MPFHRLRSHSVVSRNRNIEENRWNGQKIEKNDFPYFGASGHQKHPSVGRILKKLLQGSIHTQFYTAIKGPFGQFLLQLRTVSVKRCNNNSQKVWHASSGFIGQVRSKAGTNTFRSEFVVWAFVTYKAVNAMVPNCRDQRAFWWASANGNRCPWECKVKRHSI